MAESLQHNTSNKKLPENSGSEAGGGKGGMASNFFWKLYEKTLKVIVDAVIEGVWHK